MMECPKCRQVPGRFRIQVTFNGHVDIDLVHSESGEFEVVDSEPTDSEWKDNSTIECRDCWWSGTVAEVTQ